MGHVLMPVVKETERVAREIRLAVKAAADDETRALTRAWARAWDEVVREFELAAAEIVDAAQTGQTITTGQVRRLARAQDALEAARESIDRVLARQGRRIVTTVQDIVNATAGANARLIATQIPKTEGTTAQIAARFDRVSREALDAIVERSTDRIASLNQPLSRQASEQMLRALVRGVPAGQSPRTVARRMVRAVEGRFNGGLARALTIARTEMLDAYRVAAGAQQAANADVLQGWMWSAQLDRRTCPSCVAQHGSIHSLEEPGPWDHQNGRCARTPVVKPWKQLGFSMREPASSVTTGPEWFGAQPAATQQQILGPDRLAALNAGRASWDDMFQRRRTTGWRDSYGPTPAKDVA